MPHPTSEPILALPVDFPAVPYAAIRSRVLAAARPGRPAESEFGRAWDGLVLRYAAFADHADALAGSLEAVGTAPPPAERVRQEREIFGFFTAGVAVLETLCAGIFAVGGVLRPDEFPLVTPTDRRNATLGSTLRLYGEHFPDEELTRLLFWWLNSREYGWWIEVRGLLSRGAAPGREAEGGWRLRGEPIDAAAVAARRAWLAGVAGELLAAADEFTARRLEG